MKKVIVGWRKYSIEYKSKVMHEGVEVSGKTNYDTQRMIIDNTEYREQQQLTLLHENIHALDQEYSLFLEELDVKKFERALYTLFKVNPHLLKEIWGR